LEQQPAASQYTFYFFTKGEGFMADPDDMPSFEVISCLNDDEARSRALKCLWDHGGCHGVEIWQGERQVLRFISDTIQGE
jgi:hypothetical protein